MYRRDLLKICFTPTISCQLGTIRAFYDYLHDEEGLQLINPVKKAYRLRLPKPLPKHLKDEQVALLFKETKDARDQGMFMLMLMLRYGLRVEEVEQLTIGVMDYRRRYSSLSSTGKAARTQLLWPSPDSAGSFPMRKEPVLIWFFGLRSPG